jgi:hypothetical protein
MIGENGATLRAFVDSIARTANPMHDPTFAFEPMIWLWIPLAAIALAVLILGLRDRIAKHYPKKMEQFRARLAALQQFRWTLYLCAPGVLLVVCGTFFAIDRSREHESDWWHGLLFIPVGCAIIPLFARKSWRRYRELRRIADRGEQEYSYTEPD